MGQKIFFLKHLFEYLGGASDTPPCGLPLSLRGLWWGLWWGLLACVIFVFGGQTSKFIYIDF